MKKRIRLTEGKLRKMVRKCVNEEVMNSNTEDAILGYRFSYIMLSKGN
jgi:hypothetical protein